MTSKEMTPGPTRVPPNEWHEKGGPLKPEQIVPVALIPEPTAPKSVSISDLRPRNSASERKVARLIEQNEKLSFDKTSDLFEEARCAVCLKVCRSNDMLATHLKSHVIVECQMCGKTFENKSALRKHKKVHSNLSKKIKCNSCGKLCHGLCKCTYNGVDQSLPSRNEDVYLYLSKPDFVRETQGASSRRTSENSFDTIRDKTIASTSKQNGILSVWSDDSDDEAGMASYRNIPDSLVPNGPKRSAGRKSGSESKKQRRVSFSSKAKSTQRKRKISSGTPSVNLETRKKMKILRSVETSPSNEDNLDEESKIGEFRMEPELKLENDQLTNIATNDEPVLEEDLEMPSYETEQSDTDYASLTNSEVQGGSVVLSKGILKKHIILSEPYHDLKYCMDYPGVYLSFDKRSDEVSVGYITLNPRTIRPFEISERLGTMVIHLMKGKRTCVKSFRHDAGKKPTLDVQIIPLGGYIVVSTGVPFSVENWSDVHATLFCVVQRQ